MSRRTLDEDLAEVLTEALNAHIAACDAGDPPKPHIPSEAYGANFAISKAERVGHVVQITLETGETFACFIRKL